MQGVPVEAVQIVTGASEALVALMWLAAEPGAKVLIKRAESAGQNLREWTREMLLRGAATEDQDDMDRHLFTGQLTHCPGSLELVPQYVCTLPTRGGSTGAATP